MCERGVQRGMRFWWYFGASTNAVDGYSLLQQYHMQCCSSTSCLIGGNDELQAY